MGCPGTDHRSRILRRDFRSHGSPLWTANFPILRYTSFLMHSINALDNLWMGRPRSIAAGLLESDGHLAVVDPGPGSTLETLRQQLQAPRIGAGEHDALLPTPLHLHHADATAPLTRETP